MHQMAERIQRTDEDSSLFNSFPSSGPPRRFKRSAEELFDDDASNSSGPDNKSWNFEADDAEMRRLRSESAAQKQKAEAEEKAKVASVAKGKRKARVVYEEEEEGSEDMLMSEGEDADAEAEEDVDIEGEEAPEEVCIQRRCIFTY